MIDRSKSISLVDMNLDHGTMGPGVVEKEGGHFGMVCVLKVKNQSTITQMKINERFIDNISLKKKCLLSCYTQN